MYKYKSAIESNKTILDRQRMWALNGRAPRLPPFFELGSDDMLLFKPAHWSYAPGYVGRGLDGGRWAGGPGVAAPRGGSSPDK